MLTRQDFVPDLTADGDLLFTFSSNILDFRRSVRLIKNLARGTKTSLCSKRFRLVSELNETVEGDFRF